ncbi:cell division protein FtsL [Desertibacillus haloalkaliphilus]|nr:cell division protein FtsL [Desertibacillus haloalkaliphilus]
MGNLARDIQQQQRTEQKQVKRQVRKTGKMTITRGEKVLWSMLLVGVVVLVSIMVTNFATIYAVNKDIHSLERSISQQANVNDGLQLQVIELSAPDRILHIATEELGMTLDDNKVRVIQN